MNDVFIKIMLFKIKNINDLVVLQTLWLGMIFLNFNIIFMFLFANDVDNKTIFSNEKNKDFY